MDRMQSSASESPPESLPAGLCYPWNQSLGSQLTESKARNLEPADESAAPTGHLAAIDNPRRTRVPRQLCQASIILFSLQLRPYGSVFLDCRAFAFVAVNPRGLCHKERDYRGKPDICKWPYLASRALQLLFSERPGRAIFRGKPYPINECRSLTCRSFV